jgi:hypothetical protein
VECACDGSWVDFNTGEIHNAGKGDLILAPYMVGYPAYPTKQV